MKSEEGMGTINEEKKEAQGGGVMHQFMYLSNEERITQRDERRCINDGLFGVCAPE